MSLVAKPLSPEDLLASLAKLPMPSAPDAERGLISCLFNWPEKIEHAPPAVCFYHPAHRHIVSAMMLLSETGKPISAISVTHQLRQQGVLDLVGGAAEVSTIASEIPIPSHLDHYTSTIREAELLRRNMEAHARSIAQLAAATTGTGQALVAIDTAKGYIEEAGRVPGQLLKGRSIGQIIHDVLGEIEERSKRGGRIPGISTGFHNIDKATGGFQPGHVWIFAGMQGDGKSTIMQNCVESAAIDGAKVRWYPLEMPANEQAFRMLCSNARVANDALYTGMLSQGEQMAVATAARKMQDLGIEIVDVADATATDIFADIERSECDIAVVDYLQLMDEPNAKKSDTRESILAGISRRQKRLARRTGKTIINASQLNDDGKLRECRAIGMDADKVLVVQKFEDKKFETGTDDGRRNVWCEKNRGGRRHWTQAMRFNGSIFQFQEDA